ncbi:MAG: hydroxymethylbilane synthase [Synergistaceae bacterium]|nr:hydroxymethylbilane synthase [Synergistaceae bacterium]
MFREIREIRIGTRSSILAVAQAKIIAEKISRSWPELVINLVKIRTSGDVNMAAFVNDKPGVKGLFTLELEQALMNHEIDFAVHSLKDLPVQINEELPIIAYSEREDPRDALIMKDSGLVIGSSSLRRRLQIERLLPDSRVIPVRGNINTRLKKLDEGRELSGLVLAVSGLKRLGLEKRITKIFDISEILPAPGQGILACQGRIDEDYSYLECVNNRDSMDCALAERSFSRSLNAGCNTPVGAYAFVRGGDLTLEGLYIDEDSKEFFRGSLSGKREDADSIGKNLSEVIFS